ncbi:nuclear transport factor 2 family protein [Mucilaginibacter sp. McL0603]|uniref:nuclear transport factor 2 family protein n=1 Tax=Mucilaginibacter sp. McL0603 TaxID=3415670 RepID=UPI003CFBAAC0
MKTLLLTAFLSCTLLTLKAQNLKRMETQKESIDAISNLLENRYFKGIYEGDTSLLNTAYHPGTLLFGDVKGQPYAKTLGQYLDGVASRQSPKDSGKPFKGEILNIRVVNSIAVAEIKVTMYDFVYQEFLSFHRIDDKWLLVNKMISDIADQTPGSKSTGTPAAGIKTSLIATIRILPGFEKEVKEALKTMEIESNKEPGCEQFVVSIQKNSPQTVVVYEVYKNDEAFQLHVNSAHAKAFFEFLKGKMVDDKIETVFLTKLDSPQ